MGLAFIVRPASIYCKKINGRIINDALNSLSLAACLNGVMLDDVSSSLVTTCARCKSYKAEIEVPLYARILTPLIFEPWTYVSCVVLGQCRPQDPNSRGNRGRI